MTTYSKVTGGTAGHPSTRRKPYWVENTVDLSLFDPAANDVVQMLNVPAETLVINAGIEVLTASSPSVTLEGEAVSTSSPALITRVSAGTFNICTTSLAAGSKSEKSTVFSTQ